MQREVEDGESDADADVVVAGAGLAGCLLAVYLADRGYSVLLLESHADPRQVASASAPGARSINLALSTRGVTALRQVEGGRLFEEVARSGVPMYARCLHQRTESKPELQQYGQPGQHLLSVSRSRLHHLLLDNAEGRERVELRFDTRVISLDAQAKTLIAGADHRQFRARRLIIGADGTWSTVRTEMMRQTPAMDYSQTFLTAAYKEIHFPADSAGAGLLGSNTNALHIWPGRKGPRDSLMMLIALPNADGSFTGTLFMDSAVFKRVGVAKPDVQAFLGEYFPEVLHMRDDAADEYIRNPAPPLVTIRCSKYSANGDVLLLGDAAHAIVPFYGQGINAGFEDVRLFCEQLDGLNGNFRAAALSFSDSRVDDMNAMADLAIANYEEMAFKTSSRIFLIRKKLGLLLQRVLPSATPVYSKVTFSNIPYRAAVAKTPILRPNSASSLLAAGALATIGATALTLFAKSRQ